jgi:hypothetical protein
VEWFRSYTSALLKESDKQSDSKKIFCSRIVAEAYESVGKSIIKNASYCAPFDFIDSAELDEIHDVLIEADITAKKCVLCHQPARVNGEGSSSIAEWLSKCSEVWQTELQCLTDLLSISVHSNNSEKDEICVKIIRDSGFFDFPNHIKTDWPWLWDDDGFFNQKKSVEDQLWFIYNQILHFTETYIPYSLETFANLKILSYRFPKNFLVKEFLKTFENAIKTNNSTLERLVALLCKIIERTPKEWEEFYTKYSDIREYLRDYFSE